MRVSILNAGQQTDYLYGIVSALAGEEGLEIEVVDADCSVGLIDSIPGVKLFPLRGDNLSPQSFLVKYSASHGITCGCSGMPRRPGPKFFIYNGTTAFSFLIVHFSFLL